MSSRKNASQDSERNNNIPSAFHSLGILVSEYKVTIKYLEEHLQEPREPLE